MKKPLTRVALGVLVLALATAGVVAGVKRFTGLPANAAFEYGDKVMTQTELHHRVDLLEALYGIKAPSDAKGKDSFKRDSAKAVAVSMILDHAASSRHIEIADKQARDTLAGMVKDQLGSDGSSDFTKILGEFGVNEANVLDEIKRQQAIARLFQEVTRKAVESVTDDDAHAYFDAHTSQFAVPEQRRLMNIVVATRKEADRLLARARAGSNFGAMAKQSSLDESTRSSGGLLGTVGAAQLEDAYAKAAFSVRAGQTFGPVETKFGWNVGKVVAVKPGTAADFTAASAQVRDAVRSERAMTAWRAFLADQIKKADVEYAKAYLPAHPDAPPSQQPGVPTPGTQP
jgi:peptidyl-prolyl cis-trans isomerase C